MPEFVSAGVDSDGIATIRLDRPPLNMLGYQARAELADAVQRAASDPAVEAVILYGGAKVFSAGDDIRELRALDAEQAGRVATSVRELFTCIAVLPKPVVAAVSGYAIGSGLGLALCADWRIIGDNVKLSFDEVHHGGFPLGGTLGRLRTLVGDSRSRELLFSGRFVEPDEAKNLGLADEVVAPDDVYESALVWARRMAQAPSAAIGPVKRLLVSGSLSPENGEVEDAEFAELSLSAERRTLVDAFLDRGPANGRV